MSDLRRGKPRRVRQKVGMVHVKRAADISAWLMQQWESQVRADERDRFREQPVFVRNMDTPAVVEALAHAEAVAARLVEVIVEMQADLEYRDIALDFFALAREEAAAKIERDAARAEAQRFSDEIDRMVRELSAIRMEHDEEVAALRDDPSGENWPLLRELWLREVLADLRAKVDGLRRIVPCPNPCVHCDVLNEVLTLIDGAQ